MRTTPQRSILALFACALAWSGGFQPGSAHAQDNGAGNEADPGSKGAEAKKKTAVFIVPEAGELSPAIFATLLVTLENAFAERGEVSVIDIEQQLAIRAGKVPEDALFEARTRLSGAEGALNPDMAAAAAAEFADVLSQLQKIPTYLEPAELARAHFALGAAHAIAGKKKRALAAFRHLASWNPGYVSPAKYATGAVDKAWQKARSAVASRRRGSLSLTSEPAGALAYVDGRFVGFTPLVSEGLSQGTHYVTFRMPGRYRVIKKASVRERRAGKVKAVLKPAADADEVSELARALAPELNGEGALSEPGKAALNKLSKMLRARDVVVVRVPERASADPRYAAARFDARKRRRLSVVSAPSSPDTQTLLEDLTRSLYAKVVAPPRDKPDEPVAANKPRRKRFYQRWWFWTGVTTAVAVGVGVPLLFRYNVFDGDPACPVGSSCGQVIWRF